MLFFDKICMTQWYCQLLNIKICCYLKCNAINLSKVTRGKLLTVRSAGPSLPVLPRCFYLPTFTVVILFLYLVSFIQRK